MRNAVEVQSPFKFLHCIVHSIDLALKSTFQNEIVSKAIGVFVACAGVIHKSTVLRYKLNTTAKDLKLKRTTIRKAAPTRFVYYRNFFYFIFFAV